MRPDPRPARSRRTRLAGFALLYLVLQAMVGALRDHPSARQSIDAFTVTPAAAWIATLRPDDRLHGHGPLLLWPGGALRLQAGCDGLDVLPLFIAALLVSPLDPRRGLVALAGGMMLVWATNQGRLLALYLCLRYRPDSFDLVHAFLAPLAVLAAVAAWFCWQLAAQARHDAAPR